MLNRGRGHSFRDPMSGSIGLTATATRSFGRRRSQCFSQSHRRTAQASTAAVSHAAVARTRAKAGDRSINSQITTAKAASPKLPSAARRHPARPLPRISLPSLCVAGHASRLAPRWREKSPERRETSPHDSSEAGGNKPGNHSHDPTQSEPDQVLIPMGFA